MKRDLLLLLLLLCAHQIAACDCKFISKMADYDNSFAVFVGEIKQISEDKFVVEPNEFFKGEEFKTFISVIDDCSIFPEVGEIWLLYATKYKDEEIHVSRCGSSRSFNWPFNFNSQNFPKPIKGSETSNIDIVRRLNLEIALNELYSDLNSLRSRKQLEVTKLMSQSIDELELRQVMVVEKLNFFYSFIIILFIFMVALLIVNIQVLKRNK